MKLAELSNNRFELKEHDIFLRGGGGSKHTLTPITYFQGVRRTRNLRSYTGDVSVQVETLRGDAASVPSTIILIPGPHPDAVQAALRYTSHAYFLHSFVTLRAKLSGTVYCYRSCLWACLQRAGCVCYHDNSKLRASIFTKLGL